MSSPFTISVGALSDRSNEELATLVDTLDAAAGALSDRVHDYNNALFGLTPGAGVKTGLGAIEHALDVERQRVQFERVSRRDAQEGRRASGSD